MSTPLSLYFHGEGNPRTPARKITSASLPSHPKERIMVISFVLIMLPVILTLPAKSEINLPERKALKFM